MILAKNIFGDKGFLVVVSVIVRVIIGQSSDMC